MHTYTPINAPISLTHLCSFYLFDLSPCIYIYIFRLMCRKYQIIKPIDASHSSHEDGSVTGGSHGVNSSCNSRTPSPIMAHFHEPLDRVPRPRQEATIERHHLDHPILNSLLLKSMSSSPSPPPPPFSPSPPSSSSGDPKHATRKRSACGADLEDSNNDNDDADDIKEKKRCILHIFNGLNASSRNQLMKEVFEELNR
jgi:hypothetical protein